MLNCCKLLISNRIHRVGVNLRSILLCMCYPRQGEWALSWIFLYRNHGLHGLYGFRCLSFAAKATDCTDIRIIRNEVAKFGTQTIRQIREIRS